MTLYRVQRLTELTKRVDSLRGAEAGLSALLVLYHSYCPHMASRPQHTRKRVRPSSVGGALCVCVYVCECVCVCVCDLCLHTHVYRRSGFDHLKSNLQRTSNESKR